MKIPNVVTVVFYWFISLESLVGGSCVPEILKYLKTILCY